MFGKRDENQNLFRAEFRQDSEFVCWSGEILGEAFTKEVRRNCQSFTKHREFEHSELPMEPCEQLAGLRRAIFKPQHTDPLMSERTIQEVSWPRGVTFTARTWSLPFMMPAQCGSESSRQTSSGALSANALKGSASRTEFDGKYLRLNIEHSWELRFFTPIPSPVSVQASVNRNMCEALRYVQDQRRNV